MTPRQSTSSNLLLSRLLPDDHALLAIDLEPLPLPRGHVLFDHDEEVDAVYFIEDGMISIVGLSAEGQTLEVGIIGREGFAHPAPMLGARSIPHRLEMQIEGHGFRLPLDVFLAATRRSPTLLQFLLRYVQALLAQVSFTATANALYPVDVRLARWLLMCHDRMSTDDLHLTHQYMAAMLAVRRPSVTSSLHNLEGRGLIDTDRGYVTVASRVGLEAFAGGAYGPAEKQYVELLGPLR